MKWLLHAFSTSEREREGKLPQRKLHDNASLKWIYFLLQKEAKFSSVDIVVLNMFVFYLMMQHTMGIVMCPGLIVTFFVPWRKLKMGLSMFP